METTVASAKFWKLPDQLQRLSPLLADEIIREGDVYLCHPCTSRSKRHLLLTRMILAYSVVCATQSSQDPRVRRLVAANELRVFPFEDSSATYGLRIYSDAVTFTDLFCASASELELWCDAFSRVCYFIEIESDYRKLYKLGAGSYAQVYAAIELSTKREVAVKQVPKAKWELFPLRLTSEIAILRSLYHPGIVKLLRVYEESKVVCLVLALEPGVNLQNYLTAHGPLSEDRMRLLLRNLLQTVRFMHSNSILHRDIKPENIIVDGGNGSMTCTLVDFGFAVRADDARANHVCGTPGYIAPEVLHHKRATEISDIFSLGMAAYTGLRGRNPFVHLDKQTTLFLNEKCSLCLDPAKWPKHSPLLLDLLRKMTAKDPLERPTATQSLFHPWFNEPDGDFGEGHRKSLDRFHSHAVHASDASTNGDDRSCSVK